MQTDDPDADRLAAQQALAHIEAVLAREPGRLGLYAEAANCCAVLGRAGEALEWTARALALAPSIAALHYNHGRFLGLAGRPDEELRAYEQAIALDPRLLDAYVNRGVALRDVGRYDEALASFKAAIDIDPEHAGARNNRAQTNLLLGRHEHGWREYEWRWRDGGQSHDVPDPLWLGKPAVARRSVLVHAEQGLGDTLQFCRYVAGLAALDARVTLEVQPSLRGLLAGLDGAAQVIAHGQPRPACDFQVPLLSLPYALWRWQKQVPPPARGIGADPLRVAAWRERYAGALPPGPRIGLVWAGNPGHPGDAARSLPFELLWQGLRDSGCAFVSLQVGARAAQAAEAVRHGQVYDAGARLDDFADTAAALAELDGVVCVDTSVAHLAGTLGCPTWLLLPAQPDWRWGLHGDATEWYPGMRLCRQAPQGGWPPVLRDLADTLRRLAAAKPA